MIKKLINNFWPAIVITLVIFAFHSRLFFPHSSIYITPDYGRSDLLHSNLPAKLALSESLKNFRLPMWENLAGQGYAQLAEGIIGTFYLPNLLIYFLFPINFALPLTYLVTSLMSGLFSYLLLRKLK